MPSYRDDPNDNLPSRSNSTPSTSTFFSYPVKYAVSSVINRLSSNPPTRNSSRSRPPSHENSRKNSYTPPRTKTPPFRPPPLSPLVLEGFKASTEANAKLLTRLLAEEIRLLLPPRLQLVDKWKLVFSLDQDGASLKTLFEKCEDVGGSRAGFVLVVKDQTGANFGAYITDPPRPSGGHYYGNGECFLWRASTLPSFPTLASLPPPPSEDTTHAQRMTTIGSPTRPKRPHPARTNSSTDLLDTPNITRTPTSQSGTATPELFRFKAFPYSGINDYLIFCEQGFFSVGGGDGHYGLWIDDSLEKGVSSSCPTFGNEPLSDEGNKFGIIGVEVWCVSA